MTAWRIVRIVAAKELRETLRDRRTLVVMVIVPILLYPLLFVLMEQLALFGQRSLEQRASTVAIVGGEGTGARAFLASDSSLRLVRADSVSTADVREGRVDAVLRLSPAAESAGDTATASARLIFDESRDRSRHARDVVRERLDAWSDTLLARRLAGRGLPSSFAAPLAVEHRSVATAERLGGYTLGRILPMILVLMTVLGAFYPAIDLAAGEKERGTLETLLTVPASPRAIVAGKFVAVAAIGLGAAVLNLASMVLTFQSGLFQFARAMEMKVSLPFGSLLVVLAGLIPLAVLFSALFLGIAVRSQSFKEAQSALTPVYLASFLPTLLATMPGIEFTPALALVPVAGPAFLFRALLGGETPFVPALLALLSTAAYAAVALRFAARAFGREEVLFGSGWGDAPGGTMGERLAAWRASRRPVPLPAEALAYVAVLALLYFHLGSWFIARMREGGVIAAQVLLLAIPTVAFATLGPYAARRTLGLRRPSGRTLAAGLLIALGGVPIGWAIGWLQLRVAGFEMSASVLETLRQLTTATDLRHALWLLLVVAIVPGICEELVFRGVLLQSLAREMRGWRAVLLSAAIFAAFHLSFETAIRFLPTFWIGLTMGLVAWRSRSSLATMPMHVVNNASAVLMLSVPALRPLAISPQGVPAWWLVAAGVAAVAAGIALLPKRAGDPDDPAAAPGA